MNGIIHRACVFTRNKIFPYQQSFLIEPRRSLQQDTIYVDAPDVNCTRDVAINQSHPGRITDSYPAEQAFVKGNPS